MIIFFTFWKQMNFRKVHNFLNLSMPLSNRRRAQRQAAANRAARRAQQNPLNDAQNEAIENRRQERNQQRRFVKSIFIFKHIMSSSGI